MLGVCFFKMLAIAALTSAAVSLRSPRLARRASGTLSAVGTRISAYDFSARDLQSGKTVDLGTYRQKVSLVVNVASK